jgi:hypothetical protein
MTSSTDALCERCGGICQWQDRDFVTVEYYMMMFCKKCQKKFISLLRKFLDEHESI